MLEQLVNHIPPSCIKSNLVAVVKGFLPNTIIKQLPSVSTIRRARMVLHVVVSSLAAYILVKEDKRRQLFSDGTLRQ